jgi:hypothetical protein
MLLMWAFTFKFLVSTHAYAESKKHLGWGFPSKFSEKGCFDEKSSERIGF